MCASPVSETEGHGADLPGGQASDEYLHLVADAPHELVHGRAVHTVQVQLLLQRATESQGVSREATQKEGLENSREMIRQ